jgi:ADP-heptose:LPS heptosyltransferase
MCDTALPKIGVIYRPLKNPKLDQWIQRSRERFGFKMLSRKEGLIKAGKLLKDKQWLSLLFDQNAGKVGTLITQFDRVASATELPGLLHQKYNAKVYISHLKRVDFWRSEYVLKEIEKGEKPIETIFRAHQWLENYLSENNDQCADWLWSHKRWKTQDEPHLRFRIEHKKNALEEDAIFRKRKSPPRRTKLWVRLPNWLGDIVMAMPLIREIQNARPDFDITLLAPKSYTPWIEKTFPKLKTVALPPKGLKRFLFYYRARTQFIDVFLILTNSQRGDIEAFLTRAKQRFGIEYQKKRPLLTYKWKIPAELDWNRTHQSVLIEKLVQHFGLVKKVSNRPFHIFGLLPEDNKISILFGSDNSPEKRWPIERWRGLIGKLLGLSPKFDIYLFGTDKDIATANQIVNGFPQEHIKNLTGKTNILQFAEHLAESSLVIANDSGGLHLANFSGTPTIGLYGPTNPIRTGPFYNAIKEIISPPHCPDIGGYPIDYINEEQVMKACREILDA